MNALVLSMMVLALNTSPALSAQEIVKDINYVRLQNNVSILPNDPRLDFSAQLKAIKSCETNTTHGQTLQRDIAISGLIDQGNGENLAWGFNEAQDAVNGWVNSPSHFDNMTKNYYTHQGIGMVFCPEFQGEKNVTLIVSHFATDWWAGDAPLVKYRMEAHK